MVYNNMYAYDSRRGQNPTLGIYGNYGYNPYSVISTVEDYEDGNNYIKVMPYDEDEDLREGFIDITQPSNIPIFLLVAIIVILLLLYVV
jgi:hypothetical protein